MTILRLKNVSKTFERKKENNYVLHNLNYNFFNNGLYIISGPSGCGKSTLLNIIMGFEKASDGEVLINNKNISSFSYRELLTFRRNTAVLITQDYLLLKDLSVVDNLLLPLIVKHSNFNYREKVNQIRALITKYIPDIDPFSLVKNLSGGQAQRVCLLRSLICDTKIILADEPTGSLDSKNGEEVFKFLKELSLTKLVIVVTHDLTLAKKYSPFILTLINGGLYEAS